MKKLQNCLYITKDGVYLHKQRETLLLEQTIEGKKQKLMQLPIHSIGNIFCFGNVMVSPQLMGFCGESGTGLAFFDRNGKFLANVVGKQSGNVLLRRQQYQLADGQSVTISRNIVAAKVRTSRSILQRAQRNYGQCNKLTSVIKRKKQIVEELSAQQDYQRVLGLEGEAASQYFSVFNSLLRTDKANIRFNGRLRRPPKDPVNAVLSLLYSVLGQEISGALQSVGLDPQVGFLHKERPGRDSLALDLLEEFRCFIVDRLTLTLFNRKQLSCSDFDTDLVGGVRLKDNARKAVFQAYQHKKQEEVTHPFLKEKMAIGLIPHAQAMLLARHIRGDLKHYPPFYLT